ncbi:MAG: dTDP-4-dehydrorhamnose reductase [Phycisphaerales bacterium]|nr:MAG: dTDP-4-dehydrorhamnose reductase [Phycisphaerales bacterium]
MAENVVAILGGRGMLGSDLAKTCARRGYRVRPYDLPEFDITNAQQVKQAVADAQIIVNCAAYTNVDGAETESELAYRVNAEAVGRLGSFAKQAGAWVLHVSTDFVFDGRMDRPYLETDAPNPISEYGRTKLAGEKLLRQTGCRGCIMRVEWTYGTAGNNFVTKLVSRAKTDKMLTVVDDQVGAPTATTEVANAVCELLEKKPEGLYHFANAGYVSRFDVARFIVQKLALDVRLSRCRTSDYDSPAARPLNSRFNCRKIEPLLGGPIKPWRIPMEEFLRQL